MPRFPLFLLALVLAACTAEPFATAAPSPVPDPTAAATATASVSQPPIAAASDGGFAVTTSSKATVRVREQLVGVNFPSDAVLSTNAVTGVFGYRGGTFDPASKIAVDLTTLRSDESRRDRFIKDNTVQTSRFPNATFVPTGAGALPADLPRQGEWTFQLQGNLTIRDVTKPVTWDVQAKRSGGEIKATARTRFKFGDFGMQVPRVFTVLSIEDDIRLEIELVAKEASA